MIDTADRERRVREMRPRAELFQMPHRPGMLTISEAVAFAVTEEEAEAGRRQEEHRAPAPAQAGAFMDGPFRYHLWRSWKPGARSVVWVMLNPSTAAAGADTNDATIRKCIAYAIAWGYGSIDVINLYALRATDPDELRTKGFTVGEHTDAIARRVLDRNGYADRVIVGWGTKAQEHRAAAMVRLIEEAGFRPLALRTTAHGAPGHPLYLPMSAEPCLYDASPSPACYAWARAQQRPEPA